MEKTPGKPRSCEEIVGTGACPRAQADGVPCHELGRDCEICEAARPAAAPRPEPEGSTDALDW